MATTVPFIVIAAAAALGAAAGRTIPLSNYGPALLGSVVATLVTSATAGNRVPTLTVKDGAGNVLWGAQGPALIAASLTTRLVFGSGMQTLAPVAGGLYTVVSLSDQMVLPPGSQLTFLDSANVDVNDTVAINALLSI